jgi:hypothetical protein
VREGREQRVIDKMGCDHLNKILTTLNSLEKEKI